MNLAIVIEFRRCIQISYFTRVISQASNPWDFQQFPQYFPIWRIHHY